jgi:hypothetical protein
MAGNGGADHGPDLALSHPILLETNGLEND